MKYKAGYANGTNVKCPICKNGELFEMGDIGQERWYYECMDCGFVLEFTRPLKAEKRHFDTLEDED